MGWVLRGVPDPESVADHMYRMGFMALCLGPEHGVDTDKCIRMALVHDFAESIVGDITPHCGVSKQEKQRRETEAMDTIRDLVGDTVGSQLHQLWTEYEQGTSLESRFVKDLDKLDMILTAREYQRLHNMDLSEFLVLDAIQSESLRAIAQQQP